MESKPYTIQSPEQIAKDYGGNKQKIAEAMQMGIVDPTAGTMAGMFIDRMRSAAQTEQAPQQTVAQQVFAPPAPPTGGIGMPAPQGAPPQGAPPAGLGGTPEAAQMQAPMPEMGAPEMPAPEMPTEEAPMEMAEGGLASLPIPDTMFDEPNNGGYADGGVIAFAGGGPLGPYYEETILKTIPGTTVTSRQRSAADNARVGGVPNSYHRTDNARDFVPPKGMDAATFASLVKRTLGKGTDVINEGDHVHTEPGSRNSRMVAPMPRETDTTTAAGRGASLEDQIAFANSMYAGLPHEAMDRAKAANLEELDPEKIKKQDKYNQAEALTLAGLTLMTGGDDYNGEPVGVSIAKALKTGLQKYGESKATQKAAKSTAVRELMALEDIDRKTAVAGVELGMEAFKVGLTAEQQQRTLAFQEKELTSRETQAGLDRITQKEIAALKPSNPSDLEIMMAIMQNGTPEQKTALKDVMDMKKQQSGMALPGMEGTGNTGVDLSKWGQATVVPQ
jgi:hypothetical protein